MKNILELGYCHILKKKRYFYFYVLLALLSSFIVVLLPLLEGELINLLVASDNFKDVTLLLLLFTLLSILSMIITVLINKMYLNVKLYAKNSLILFVIDKLYSISLIDVSKTDKISLNERIHTDCEMIIDFSMSIYSGFILNSLSTIWIIAILSSQSLILTILIGLLFTAYVLLYILMREKIYKADRLSKDAYSEYFSILYKLNVFLRSIKLNSFQRLILKQQKDSYQSYTKAANNQLNIENMNECITSFIGICANIIIFLFGGYLVFKGKVTIGLLVVVSNYFSNLFTSADFYLNFGSTVQSCKVSYHRLGEILNIKSMPEGTTLLSKIETINFENFSLPYFKNTDIVINANLKQGEVYWLKGKNGTGKSTFINVLLGLFGCEFHGTIKINNINFNELDKADFRYKHIALTEQDPFLLDGMSIVENITLDKDIDIRQSAFDELVKGFNMMKVINEKKDMDYSDMNSKFSGGERQKIVLIRTLLSDSDILIFDEPTSALDEKSINFFYDCIKKIKHEKIILIVSHEQFDCYDKILSFEV